MQRKRLKKVLLVRLKSSLPQEVGHPRSVCPPWRLKYMQAILRESRTLESKLIDLFITPLSLQELLEVSLSWQPDLLVVSSTTLEFQLTLEYAALIKEYRKDLTIVSVGQDPSTRPREYLFCDSPIDLVLPGEAEVELLPLIERLNSGFSAKLANTIIASNLETLPFPDYTLEELRKYILIYPLRVNKNIIWGQILTSRGCPHQCLFCSPMLRYSYGKQVRLRKAAAVADEIEYLIKRGANMISFEDDNFTASRSHVISVCQEIQKRGLKFKWISHARIDEVTSDLLKIMQESGCVLLRFGIESGSARIIKILKKCSPDVDWVEKAREILGEAKKVGIATNAMFIVGSPDETKEDIAKTIRLARELEPDIIQVALFTLYPGSDIFNHYKERLAEENILKMYHYSVGSPNLSQIDSCQLQNIQKIFYLKVLLRPKFMLKHFLSYCIFYLFNPRIFFKLFSTKFLLGLIKDNSNVIKGNS